MRSAGKRKRRRALRGGGLGQFLQRDAADLGQSGGRDGDPGRLVVLAPVGVGAEVGGVGLDQEAVERDPGGGVPERVEGLVGEGQHPGEGDVEAQGQELLGLGPGPGERVEDAPDRPTEAGELVDDVAVAIPAVDDDGQVESRARSRWRPKKSRWTSNGVRSQWRSRPVSPMATTSGRPARSRIRSQSSGPGLGRLVGVDADGGEDARDGRGPSPTTDSLSSAVVATATTWTTPALGAAREDLGQPRP